jgi:hypothetical protein
MIISLVKTEILVSKPGQKGAQVETIFPQQNYA